MPEKDLGVWSTAFEWLSQHAPFVHAVLLSMVIAVVRVIYGGGKWRAAMLESIFCGLITIAAFSGMEWFGVPATAAAFIGGCIGGLGVKKISEYADRFIGRKAGSP